MIADEEMVVTVTHGGYVKRNPKTLYRAQRRGGRGITGAATHEEDFVAQLFVASTHDTLLMFTNKGRAYSKKVYELPQAGRTAQGQGVRQPARAAGGRAGRGAAAGARVLRGGVRGHGDPPATSRRPSLDAFANIRSSGIIALTIDEDDDLVAVRITEGSVGHAARHPQRLGDPLPRRERAPDGPHRARRARHQAARRRTTRWWAWRSSRASEPATLLTVCERGYGKRTPTSDYPTKNRGGKGVITIKTTERNGKVVGLRLVTDDDDLMLITDGGKLIRMPVDGIPTIGRNTQGVRLIRLEEAEKVVAMERMAEKEEGEREVAPEVAAARAEQQAEPLAAEDLGDEAAADDDDGGRRGRRGRRTTKAADEGGEDGPTAEEAEPMPTDPGDKRPRSSTLFERAQALFPGGVNSPVRAFKAVGGTPVFLARGVGRVRLRRRRQPVHRLRRLVGAADPRATPTRTCVAAIVARRRRRAPPSARRPSARSRSAS